MKLRSLLLLVAGIGLGYAFAKKMREDDPNVVTGPQRTAAATGVVTAQAHRLADAATAKSLEAIRRARGAIRDRLSQQDFDDATWN